MNIKTVLAAGIFCGLVSLTGCAGMQSKDSSAMNLNSGISDDIDVAYMTMIDYQANEKGIGVIWVNPPQKDPLPQHD